MLGADACEATRGTSMALALKDLWQSTFEYLDERVGR
jgi:hypothetical protein